MLDSLRELRSLLARWTGAVSDCACGRLHSAPTGVIRLDDDGGALLPPTIRDLPHTDARRRERRAAVLLVADLCTFAAHGRRVLNEIERSGLSVAKALVLEGDGVPVAPDGAAVLAVVEASAKSRAGTLVAVGSGTITDICKAAATHLDATCVVCPTAASMNGYTSTIAALKRDGLKVTDAANGADAVLVDLDVIAAAPPAMTAAGVADLLSKFVCNADWTLAHLLDGGYYCPVPADLASRATEAVVAHLASIAAGDRAALELLMSALLLSGMSMAMAGSSSPASGGEHLISHYWDMVCPGAGARRFHGTQVGIGILLSATLYERLRRIDAATIRPETVGEQAEEFAAVERAIRAHFGPAADAVIEQSRAKHLSPARAADRAAMLARRWREIWRTVDPILKSAAQVRDWLRTCGAPTTVAELGLSHAQAADALRWARRLRNRFTVFDVAAQIGAWTESDQADVLRDSGV